MQNDTLTAKILVNIFQVSEVHQVKMSNSDEENDAQSNKLQGVSGEDENKEGTGQTRSILNSLHSELYFMSC